MGADADVSRGRHARMRRAIMRRDDVPWNCLLAAKERLAVVEI
jgi:hypothetical protein